MKKKNLLICFSLSIICLLVPYNQLIFAQWPTDPATNVAISRSGSQEQHPIIVSDGADGGIVVWQIQGIQLDLEAMRISAGGALIWNSSVSVSSANNNQRDHHAISDGAGGVIVVWTDQRNEANGGDIYAQRIDANGNVKWTTDGISICTAANVQAYPKMVSDGVGGAIITWRDSRNSTQYGVNVDIYAQRIDASGNIKWTANGVPICSAGGNQLDPIVVSDGAGGAIIAWMDERDFNTGRDVYAQRVNASGVVQWTTNGVGYKANGNQEWKSGYSPIASDGAGGAIIAWEDDYFGTNDIDIRCLRVDANGSFPWSPASIWIGGSGNNQVFPHVAYNGFKSVVITWVDYRNGSTNPDIYAQRITSSGQPKWSGDWGIVICNASDRQEGLKIINDDFGGVIIAWHDYRNSAASGVDVYAQRIDSLGVSQWAANGSVISKANKAQDSPALVKAGTCGAIVAWRDLRWVGHAWDDTDWDIYAQRVFCDGTFNPPNNTPTGTNVAVDPGNDVKLTFDNVTTAGTTTVTLKTTGTTPPGGFQIIPAGGPPTYYNIQTTATFTGKVKICISYDDGNLTVPEKDLKLQVYENPPGQWKDITTSVDDLYNIICGETTHFSEFAVMFSSGGTGTPQHFTFTSGTGDSYSIIIDDAQIDGSPLSVGDEIGVFTPTGLCVGASVWDGTKPLGLTAWADDNQTQNVVDGYKSGEKMFFKVWIASSNEKYQANPTYSQGSGNFGDGPFAEVSVLEAFFYATQAIDLPQGWSWMSFAVNPDDASIDKLMAGATDLEIVINGAGQFYVPNKVNQINQMSYLEGYKIYVTSAGQLAITGKLVYTEPIVVNSGWNFVSYLPGDQLSVDAALSSVLPNLVIVKNDDGGFYVPNKVNTLGMMKTGEGYKMYINNADTLNYPLVAVLPKTTPSVTVSGNMPAKHFSFPKNTGENYSIIVQSLRLSGAEPNTGDEIGVFTASGLCVGAGVWNGSGVLGIAAWKDDEITQTVDGYGEDEEILFRYWNASSGEEIPLESRFGKGNGWFGDGVFAEVELESFLSPTPKSYILEQNYPNPFNPETEITFHVMNPGKVELKIFNLKGREIVTLLNQNMEPGIHHIQWNGRDRYGKVVPSGVYIYKLTAGSFSDVKKALLVK